MRLRALALGLLLLGAPVAAQPPPQSPDSPERAALLDRAAAALAARRSAEAARLLREAADRFHSVRALLQLARLQSAAGGTRAALETLAEARALAPNSEDVLSAVARVSLDARLPVPAIRALEPLTRMHPDEAPYHYLLGVAFMQAGDMASAVDALQRADEREPNRVLTLVALGLALNNARRHAEARDVLMRSLALNPEHAEGLAALAEAEDSVGNPEAAAGYARRALARAGTHPTAHLVIGRALMRQERYAEAREAFEKAAAADPDSPRIFYQLSLAYARLGDAAGSQKYVELYREKLREVEERLKQLRAGSQ